MPQVKELVSATYPDIPIKMFEPNTAVAKGAAIHANNLLQGITELQKWKDVVKSVTGEEIEVNCKHVREVIVSQKVKRETI